MGNNVESHLFDSVKNDVVDVGVVTLVAVVGCDVVVAFVHDCVVFVTKAA